MMSLMVHYDAAVKSGSMTDSSNQRQLLLKLQKVTDAVIDSQASKHWWSLLSSKSFKGLYIYGPVGAGKTYLMDLFFRELPEKHKARFHFHHFMQHVDELLRALQGHVNPLREIAKKIATEARVLCLDEFLVEDVADASILAALLDALFREGIILVATANTKPDDLYLGGLHRARFLPAIALLKKHCEVVCLDEHRDYRMGRDHLSEAYFFPANAANEAKLQAQFNLLTNNAKLLSDGAQSILVQHREISCIAKAPQVVWFDFNMICNLPRSQLDYLELASRFKTIFISHVPAIGADNPAQAILFIRFVDVMYDAKIRLVLLAEVPLEMIYPEGPMQGMFERTLSRLREMQSSSYLK